MNLSLMLVFLFLTTGANETGVGFQAQQNQTHRRLASPNKLVQLPCYLPNLSIRLNQEEVDIPEIEPRTGCFLVNWGVPRWAVQGSATFVGGHLGGWLASGMLTMIPYGLWGLSASLRAWVSPGSFDGWSGLAILFYYPWCYVGVPVGTSLTTMWVGKLVHPGGKWWPTALGALAGEALAIGLNIGYHGIFGSPWYHPQGGSASLQRVKTFIYTVMAGGSILPTAGAIIGYNLSVPKDEKPDMGMLYERTWDEHVRESLVSSREDYRTPRLELTLVRVSF